MTIGLELVAFTVELAQVLEEHLGLARISRMLARVLRLLCAKQEQGKRPVIRVERGASC